MSRKQEQVAEALGKVIDPQSGRDVVAAGRVSGIVVRDDSVGFIINVRPEELESGEALRRECEQVVAALPGVAKVTAVLTAENAPGADETLTKPPRGPLWNRVPVESVSHIVAVASGKGGVGKSTVTVCLAYALASEGLRVGILDADIYGPSIPLMMGLSGEPAIEGNRMVPLVKNGIACMSMGFLIGDEAAILRGPMVTKALNQMLRAAAWGTADAPLDVLLVDMPPGTGDVHLSLAQQTPLSGAVVVTTPQQVAAIDARKGVQMFRKVGVPVFGIIENMSFLKDPVSGHVSHPFGAGGGERLAREMATLFLGQVPLEPSLGAAVDQGALSAAPQEFTGMARQIRRQLDIREQAAS